MAENKKTGLDLLREPFPANLISKLPKPTINNDEWKKLPKGPCKECGGYHATSKTIHLDYVGHAALTARLLDCDPAWNWAPLAVDITGIPQLDKDGGMWITLTVCGITRLGYGDSQGKTGANATKERIGDALRNAAMRFGAALDLWSKADLHGEDDAKDGNKETPPPAAPSAPKPADDKTVAAWIGEMTNVAKNESITTFRGWWKQFAADVTADCGDDGAAKVYTAWAAKGAELAKKATEAKS